MSPVQAMQTPQRTTRPDLQRSQTKLVVAVAVVSVRGCPAPIRAWRKGLLLLLLLLLLLFVVMMVVALHEKPWDGTAQVTWEVAAWRNEKKKKKKKTRQRLLCGRMA